MLQSRRDVRPCGEREEAGSKDQVKVANGSGSSWREVGSEEGFGACKEVDFGGFEELWGAEAVQDAIKVPQVFEGSVQVSQVFEGSLRDSCGSEGLPEEVVSEEKAYQEPLEVRETLEEDVGVEDQVIFGEEVKEEEDFLQEE